MYADIKPENLLINMKTKVLKLCDFGFARVITQTAQELTDYVATRWYRAPELLLGSTNYTFGVDMWAIGCIMGEISDGQPLFPGESEVDQLFIVQKILGPLISEHVELFMANQRFAGLKFPDMSKPETLQKKYVGKFSKRALNFMRGLLSMDPADRPTSSVCLMNAYFEGMDSLQTRNSSDSKALPASSFNVSPRGMGGGGGGVVGASVNWSQGINLPSAMGKQIDRQEKAMKYVQQQNPQMHLPHYQPTPPREAPRDVEGSNVVDNLDVLDEFQVHNLHISHVVQQSKLRHSDGKAFASHEGIHSTPLQQTQEYLENCKIDANDAGSHSSFVAQTTDFKAEVPGKIMQFDVWNFDPLSTDGAPSSSRQKVGLKGRGLGASNENKESNEISSNVSPTIYQPTGQIVSKERDLQRARELDKEAERERERQREKEIRAFREFSTKLPIKQHRRSFVGVLDQDGLNQTPSELSSLDRHHLGSFNDNLSGNLKAPGPIPSTKPEKALASIPMNVGLPLPVEQCGAGGQRKTPRSGVCISFLSCDCRSFRTLTVATCPVFAVAVPPLEVLTPGTGQGTARNRTRVQGTGHFVHESGTISHPIVQRAQGVALGPVPSHQWERQYQSQQSNNNPHFGHMYPGSGSDVVTPSPRPSGVHGVNGVSPADISQGNTTVGNRGIMPLSVQIAQQNNIQPPKSRGGYIPHNSPPPTSHNQGPHVQVLPQISGTNIDMMRADAKSTTGKDFMQTKGGLSKEQQNYFHDTTLNGDRVIAQKQSDDTDGSKEKERGSAHIVNPQRNQVGG